jgi:hypothetical protein
VSEENVLRFVPSPEAGMARRGAPDKTQGRQSENVEVVCPYCDAVLFLEVTTLAVATDVLCVGCDATFPLAGAETADLRR